MQYNYPMMHGYDNSWGIIMMIFWIIIIIVIVAAVMRLLRSQEQTSNHKTDPLGIVKERYAKGEIKKDEFEQLKRDLV